MRTVFSGNAMKPHYGAAGGAAVAPEKRTSFEERMREIVVGQEAAITAVSRAVKLYQAGLAPSWQPAGVFLFLGPTGTGKTLVASAMAEVLHGDPRRLITLDMNEFQRSHEIARLVGAPPGYLGHRETTPLLSQQKLNAATSDRCSIRIILLDEVEKADKAIFDHFLSAFDKGTMKLGDNTEANFSGAIFLLTSNLGTKQLTALSEAPGFGRLVGEGRIAVSQRAAESTIQRALRRKFRPEFLNRITETVVFQPLTRADVGVIVDREMDKLQEFIAGRLGLRAPHLTCSPKVREWLVDKGMSPDWGAREVIRLISKEITVQVAELLLDGNDGAALHVHVADDRLVVAVKERR